MIYRRRFRITNLSPKYTIYAVKWTFHLSDDDPEPTIPHGHGNLNGDSLKLSLWDGEVLKKSGKKWVHKGWASKSELTLLYADQQMRDFVDRARDWYIENHRIIPNIRPRKVLSISRLRRVSLKRTMKIKKADLDKITVVLHCNDNSKAFKR